MKIFTIKWATALTCLLTVLLVACRKDAMKYNSSDSVYFSGDSTVYSFFGKPSSLTQDTVRIQLKLIGKLASTDRGIDIAVEDSSTAKENVDFKIIRPVVMSKDSVNGAVKLVLLRTSGLQTSSKQLWVSLHNSADLNVAQLANNAKRLFKLRYSDKIEKPTWWPSYFYMFNFSVTRMQFYINVMGSAASPTSFAPTNGLYYTVYKLKTALADYNASHSSPLTDEYGPISWEVAWLNY